ncbi:hypothetical protein REPUB_Repub08aG0110700 [Reevesia pubescens]
MDLASCGSHWTTLKLSSSTYSKLLANINCTIIMAASRLGIPHSFLLASQTNIPRLAPPSSPPSLLAFVSPIRTSKPVSPRTHSISFSTSRNKFDDRPSISSSDSGSQTG